MNIIIFGYQVLEVNNEYLYRLIYGFVLRNVPVTGWFCLTTDHPRWGFYSTSSLCRKYCSYCRDSSEVRHNPLSWWFTLCKTFGGDSMPLPCYSIQKKMSGMLKVRTCCLLWHADISYLVWFNSMTVHSLFHRRHLQQARVSSFINLPTQLSLQKCGNIYHCHIVIWMMLCTL